jgi:hypothetical protein
MTIRHRNCLLALCVLSSFACVTAHVSGLEDSAEELALAEFGRFVRSARRTPPEPQTVQTIVDMGKRSGMQSQVAFILAFNQASSGQAELIDALATHKDGSAQELAAATLATLHCRHYTADSSHYLSARNDLKVRKEAAPGKVETVKRGGKQLKKAQVAGNLAAIPGTLFVSRQRTTRDLALVAAAFSGDPAYKQAVANVQNPTGTAAGAMLLYLARQEAELTQEQVVGLFRAATGGAASPSSRPSSSLFGPLLPGGALACMGLAELGEQKNLPLLIQALSARDSKVQIDAVRAIRRLGPDDAALAAVSQALMTAEWPLLVELCATLGAHPDKRVVPALIQRLERENGRLRLDIVHALSSIAGEQKGSTAREWKEWWQTSGAGFEVVPDSSRAYREKTRVQDVEVPSIGFFYGLPIFSDRLVYVVDTSQSMRGARIDSLRENLVSSLEGLRSAGTSGLQSRRQRVSFNIVDFGGDVVTMYDGGLTDDIDMGITRTKTMPLTYGTRSYDAMERGMALAGTDTIYFLSDGAPVRGQIEKWGHIIAAMDLLMLHRPVAIWSVAFDPSGGNAEAMTTLAEENFGRYEAPHVAPVEPNKGRRDKPVKPEAEAGRPQRRKR